jgi:hypothetical protein
MKQLSFLLFFVLSFFSCSSVMTTNIPAVVVFTPCAMRVEPAENAKALRSLPMFARVELTGERHSLENNREFVKIKYNNETGYVLSGNLQEDCVIAVSAQRLAYSLTPDSPPEDFVEAKTILLVSPSSLKGEIARARLRSANRWRNVYLKAASLSAEKRDTDIYTVVLPIINTYLNTYETSSGEGRKKQLELAISYIDSIRAEYSASPFFEDVRQMEETIKQIILKITEPAEEDE